MALRQLYIDFVMIAEWRTARPHILGTSCVCASGSVSCRSLWYGALQLMLLHFNSVLLDDVLAAVDAHVARHVFG